MSERGSPSDHATTENDKPQDDGLASSSPADETVSDGTDAKSQTDDSSPSEGAKKEDEPKATLADVMKAAAALPDNPLGKSPDPANEGSQDKVDPDADGDKKAATEQDDSKLSFHRHPRWQEVTGQVRELRTEVETLKPDADQYRKINSFMTEHRLTPDEVGDLFIVGAMAKAGDPRALQRIDEWRKRVALGVGEALPDDIQAKVDSGEISEAAAKELAKAKATATHTERQLADREAEDRNAKAAKEAEAMRVAQEAAVGEWDSEMRMLDPDFAKKENAIARYAKALIQEHGPPPTPKDALALVNAAYSQVNKDFKAALPPKSSVQRGPIASSTTGAKAQPKTLREVMERAASV